jgi:hypothetical protein
MSWRFEQRTGKFGNTLHAFEGFPVYGYSGHEQGKNNPALQQVHEVGPIPIGEYLISMPFDHPTKGPLCMRLSPLPATETFGRSGFLIHGDSIAKPGTASEGCIILPHAARNVIASSADYGLEVVSGVQEEKQLA